MTMASLPSNGRDMFCYCSRITGNRGQCSSVQSKSTSSGNARDQFGEIVQVRELDSLFIYRRKSSAGSSQCWTLGYNSESPNTFIKDAHRFMGLRRRLEI